MKQILCFASRPWRDRPNRTQRFLSAFPNAKILYLEPESPNETPREGLRVAPMTYVYTLPKLSAVYPDDRTLGLFNTRKLTRFIQGCMDYHGFEEPLLWACSPLCAELLDCLPHTGLIYDCDQDWSHLPILWESRLTYRADIVFAASDGLREHLAPCSQNILVVPNGLDTARYHPQVTIELPTPRELLLLPRPIFGYAGTVWPNLDLAPALSAAKAHPDWQFVFLGRVSRRNATADRLAKLPNVHFLGAKKVGEIPAYLRHLDVGMSFLQAGLEDNDVLSPRIYEYLAVGLPVVAMYHHTQTEHYPTLIDSAYSPEGFVRMCEKVLEHDSIARKLERVQLAMGCDWSERCRTVADVVSDSRLLGE